MASGAEKIFKSNGWRRLVAGLLILSWVNVAAQPCLMAVEAADEHAAAMEHTAHAGHASSHASGHDCDHCPPGDRRAGPDCDAGLNADCGALPNVAAENRKSGPEPKEQSTPAVAMAIAVPVDRPVRLASACPSDVGLLKYATAPALSIRYCVYLK